MATSSAVCSPGRCRCSILCAGCGRNACEVGHALLKCNGCRLRHYCGEECQRSDWRRGHRDMCRDLQQAQQDLGVEPYDAVRRWIRRGDGIFGTLALKLLVRSEPPSNDSHRLVLLSGHVSRRTCKVRIHSFRPMTMVQAQLLVDASLPQDQERASLEDVDGQARAAATMSGRCCWALVLLLLRHNNGFFFRVIPQTVRNSLLQQFSAPGYIASLPEPQELLSQLNA